MSRNHNCHSHPKNLDPREDAACLYRACEGHGEGEMIIIEIAGNRSLAQRLEIRKVFEQIYEADLTKAIASKMKGNARFLAVNLFRTPMELLAHQLYRSLNERHSVNTNVLTNILCCCNHIEIHLLGKAYNTLIEETEPRNVHHRTLATDIERSLKGPYGLLMDNILRVGRHQDSMEDLRAVRQTGDLSGLIAQGLVEQDVKALHTAAYESTAEKRRSLLTQKVPPEASIFISILTKRSRLHIKAIWEMYKQKYGMNLVTTICETFSEPLRTALNTTVMAQVNLPLLLVCQLHEAVTSSEVNESQLIRLICLHLEMDLRQLTEDYQAYFDVPFKEAIRCATSGAFLKLLLTLLS
ncbi:annexin A13 [Clonorchis sinensis]|uniref:Annexin A13 n=1 Tax=Clonorchis sinensis TaxID=79923 RepID=G7Y7L0_CLOSI|nr:annexin A13 [Clonorchis sinensis]